jgi:hypothetical protein
MDVERIRIAGCELARSRDSRANLPNAAEWARAARIIELLDRYDTENSRPTSRCGPRRTAVGAEALTDSCNWMSRSVLVVASLAPELLKINRLREERAERRSCLGRRQAALCLFASRSCSAATVLVGVATGELDGLVEVDDRNTWVMLGPLLARNRVVEQGHL